MTLTAIKEGPLLIPGEKRKAARQPVLRAAKILISNSSVVDCLVLDLSPQGVRVSTEAFVAFPDQVVIEMRTGGMWVAARRWQRGLETGFELVRFAGLHPEGVAGASKLYDQLRNAGVRDVTARLAEARYFDHPALKTAAEVAEAAIDALERVLRVAAGRG